MALASSQTPKTRLLDKINLLRIALFAVALVLIVSVSQYWNLYTRRKPLPAVEWPRFVLLGDSLSQNAFDQDGSGTALQNLYQRRMDILNRGFSGYPTETCALSPA